MIRVKFTVERGHCPKKWLFDSKWENMPWMDYLIKNHKKLSIIRYFQASEYLDILEYCFELTPQKEMFYRLKYNS